MTLAFCWVLVAVTVGLVIEGARPDLVGRGRIFSRWMRRLPGFRRLYSPVVFRVVQYLLLCSGLGPIVATFASEVDWAVSGMASGVVFIALFVDDYLTGDDDRWRRYRAAARNAVRWLMDLPRPAQPDVA